jgi:hypothetical protein
MPRYYRCIVRLIDCLSYHRWPPCYSISGNVDSTLRAAWWSRWAAEFLSTVQSTMVASSRCPEISRRETHQVLEVYALHLSRDLAYIVGVAPINSTLCNTFHHQVMIPESWALTVWERRPKRDMIPSQPTDSCNSEITVANCRCKWWGISKFISPLTKAWYEEPGIGWHQLWRIPHGHGK